MDNLTHSLVGALIGQTGLKRKTGLAMPALIIGANLPDVDAACFFWLDGVQHLAFRRGITHGPPALVLLPLILAGLLYGFDRWQAKRGKRSETRLPVSFKWLYVLSFAGCLTHPALDWLNVYGIRLLEPFSSEWFYGDTLFIIDIWLWGLMGFATWWSLRQEKRGGTWRKTGRQALSIALAYIGVNAGITGVAEHQVANSAAQPVVTIANPPPVEFWRREVIYLDPSPRAWMQQSFSLPSSLARPKPVAAEQCLTYIGGMSSTERAQFEPYWFWSRAPFFERDGENGLLLRDARFYDPRARDRFSVALPDLQCLEPGTE